MEKHEKLIAATIKEFSKEKNEKLLKEYKNIADEEKLKTIRETEEIEKTDIISLVISKDLTTIIPAFKNLEYKLNYKYSSLFKLITKDYEDFLNKLPKNIIEVKDNTSDINAAYSVEHKAIKINFYQNGTKLVGDEAVKTERLLTCIVKLHEVEEENYLEISIDSIPHHYRKTATEFFLNKIDDIRSWLENEILLTLEPMDFNHTVEKMRKNEDNEDFLVSAQHMNINTGSKATLDSAASNNIVLPILDEIKYLLRDNEGLFEDSQEGYKLLSEYINDLEEESDLPWVTLKYIPKNLQVKFLFETATKRDYTLLNYYHNNKMREGMNNVAESIIREYCTNPSQLSESSHISNKFCNCIIRYIFVFFKIIEHNFKFIYIYKLITISFTLFRERYILTDILRYNFILHCSIQRYLHKSMI